MTGRPCQRDRRGSTRPALGMCVAMLMCIGMLGATAHAEEIYSNGYGGGRWSDASTWKGASVPGPDDRVVISGRDEVTFDLNNPASVTCAALALDPRSTLQFRMDSQPHIMTVAGPVESYGTIRMNARGSREAHHELRLVAEEEADRRITLKENGALLVYGNRALSQTQRNAVLAVGHMPGAEISKKGDEAAADGEDESDESESKESDPEDEQPEPRFGAIRATDQTMLDIQDAHVVGLRLHAEQIDNTGYQADERLNVVGSYLTAGSSIAAVECDTPMFANNRFVHDGDERADASAIHVNECKLPQIRGNHISNYRIGINVDASMDTTVQDNVLVNCGDGIWSRHRNVMIQGGEMRGCDVGIHMWKGYGIIENVTIKSSRVAGVRIRSTIGVELRNTHVIDSPENKHRINSRSSSITTVNCNLTPGTTHFELDREQDRPWIGSWYYMIVRVTGDVPDDAQVMVHTEGFDTGSNKRDSNVRNPTATLDDNGTSPRRGPTRVITVRGWTLNGQRESEPAPKYTVTVQQPPKKDGEKAKVLARKTVQPDQSWYRAEPGSAEPMVTIALDE